MRSLISQSIPLALVCGMVLTGSLRAEEAETKLKPVPESTPVSNYCPNCQGQGGMSYYDSSYGYGYGDRYQGGRRGTRSPGRGWCAPSKVTVQRERVQYYKWYPNYWSGQGPGQPYPYHPMVYTPTDTAQLGYYYQHAPHWTAQPWRTPGPAHPGVWHNRYCGKCQAAGGYCPSCYNQSGYYGGQVTYGNYDYGQPVSSEPAPAEAKPADDSEVPQSLFLPEPSFVPRAPVISVLPDAPPEV